MAAEVTARFLTREELPKWDEFVRAHPLGTVYHLSSWQALLERSFDHMRGQVAALVDDTSGRVVAGIPVCCVRSWLLGNRIVSVPFAGWCDPLVRSKEELTLLLGLVESLRASAGAKRIELRILWSGEIVREIGLRTAAPFCTHHVDLGSDPAKLRTRFSRLVRRMISNAESSEVRVAVESGADSERAFYRLLLEGRQRLGLPAIPEAFFREWFCRPLSDNVSLFVARRGGECLGGLLVLNQERMSHFEYLACSKTNERLGVGYALYWAAMQRAIAMGIRTCSFGRTALANAGLVAFKERWASQTLPLANVVLPGEAFVKNKAREQTLGYKLARKMLSRLPLNAYIGLGRFLYRHMG